MDIPEDVIRAAAQKMWEMDDAAAFDGWDELASSYRAELIGVAEIAVSAGAEWARKQTLEEAAQIAHMVHYAAECSTDGMLSVGMQSRSNAAFEIRNAIRALGTPQTQEETL